MKKDLGSIKDYDTREALNHVQEEYSENILELSAAPTATAPLLQDKQRGKYGNDLYYRIGSTILKFSSDSQITIT